MEPRTLVTYATKAGSTAEIAARLGQQLSASGQGVDVLPIAKVKDLAAYSTVVLGSAIRMGRVLPEVQAFVEKNASTLGQKHFNVFIVCMTLNEDTPANRAIVGAYLDPLRAAVKPESEGLFAGVMNPSRLSLLERLLMMAMKTPQGDFRNWEQIAGWGRALAN